MEKYSFTKQSFLFVAIVYLFILIPVIVIGVLLANYLLVLGLLAAASFLLIAISYFINFFIIKKRRKVYDKAEIVYQLLEDEKKKIIDNKSQYFKEYNKYVRLGNIYLLVFNVLILFIILFLSGAILVTEGASIIGIAYIAIFQFLMLPIIFLSPKEEIVIDNKINLDEYPKIKDVIYKALEIAQLDIHNKLDVIIPDTNVFAVSKRNNRYRIILGLRQLRAYNEKELISILLHEIGHIKSSDLEISKRIYKNEVRWQMLSDNSIYKVFFKCLGFEIYKRGFSYLSTISLESEKKADEYVHKCNYTDSYNSANIKVFMMMQQDIDAFQYNLFHRFEKMPENYFEEIYKLTILRFEEKKEDWYKKLILEIPLKTASHPVLSKRLVCKNVEDIKINFYDQEKELTEEVHKLFLLNQEKISKDYWNENRKYYYTNLKDIFEEYEKDGNTKEYGLFNIGLMYSIKNDLDNALDAFNKVLEKHPNYSDALYFKGLILADRNNNECLEYYKKSIETNRFYFNEVSGQIINYCLFHGLEKELNEYDEWLKNKSNDLFEIEKCSKRNKIKYVKSQVSSAVKEELTVRLKSLKVNDCYIIGRKYNDVIVETVYMNLEYIEDDKENWIRELSIKNVLNELLTNFDFMYNVFPIIKRRKHALVFKRGI